MWKSFMIGQWYIYPLNDFYWDTICIISLSLISGYQYGCVSEARYQKACHMTQALADGLEILTSQYIDGGLFDKLMTIAGPPGKLSGKNKSRR